MQSNHKTTHQTISVDGRDIFFRCAGDVENPAILLLHGFPSSSHMFRNVVEPLAQAMYVVAPDLPGFGFSDAPSATSMTTHSKTSPARSSSFSMRSDWIDSSFSNDSARRSAITSPRGILTAFRGLIVQNGNAHEAGLGPQWDAPKALWADPTAENKAKLPEWLNFEGTRAQYIGDLPEPLKVLYPPECWFLDSERMSRPGNIEIQFEIFQDYRNHVARFPAIEAYHREHQPPCLLLWGRHDTFFDLDEIMAYSRDLDVLEMHVFESGHFLLETHHQECAALIKAFVRNVETGLLRSSLHELRDGSPGRTRSPVLRRSYAYRRMTMIMLVHSGTGVTLVPGSFASGSLDGIVTRPLSSTEHRMHVAAAYRDEDMEGVVAQFLRVASATTATSNGS